MNKYWVLMYLVITIGLVGCSQTPAETLTEETNYGFYDTSYENPVSGIEDLNQYTVIELNSYGETDREIENKYQSIMAYLKEAGLTEDDYIGIYEDPMVTGNGHYVVVKNELEADEFFSLAYVLKGDSSKGHFDVVKGCRLDGQINEAKTSVFSRGDHLLISTEYPASAQILNFYLKWDETPELLKTATLDPMLDYLEKRKKLLEEGQVEAAFNLKPVNLYPHNYKDMIDETNNLALRKFYQKAQNLSDEEKYSEAYDYLHKEVWDYIDRYMMTADTISDFIESDKSTPYSLNKEEVLNRFNLYKFLLEKTDQLEDIEIIQGYIDEMASLE